MRKGTIVLIPFPFTDLSGKKVRPAVVLYDSRKGEDFIAAFISSTPLKNSTVFGISVAPSKLNGLKVQSHIRIDKLATLQKQIVIGELGEIEPAIRRQIDAKLRTLLGL